MTYFSQAIPVQLTQITAKHAQATAVKLLPTSARTGIAIAPETSAFLRSGGAEAINHRVGISLRRSVGEV